MKIYSLSLLLIVTGMLYGTNDKLSRDLSYDPTPAYKSMARLQECLKITQQEVMQRSKGLNHPNPHKNSDAKIAFCKQNSILSMTDQLLKDAVNLTKHNWPLEIPGMHSLPNKKDQIPSLNIPSQLKKSLKREYEKEDVYFKYFKGIQYPNLKKDLKYQLAQHIDNLMEPLYFSLTPIFSPSVYPSVNEKYSIYKEIKRKIRNKIRNSKMEAAQTRDVLSYFN